MISLYNAQHLQSLCKKYKLAPSKNYGQNYLIDASVIDKIIETAQLSVDDTVLEVGPGFGVLTLALVEKVNRVIAFEIEKKLQPYWNELLEIKKLRNLEIMWGNILKEFPISNFQYPKQYKILANLPYQITSPIIRLFLEAEHPPTEMILMVQKEVAERICAKPGDMSLLSVAVQYYAEPEIVAAVPRSSFWPQPKVDSAIIQLKIQNSRFQIPDSHKFFQIVKAAFAHRRKLLSKNLASIVGKGRQEKLLKIFDDFGLSKNARAQELSTQQWRVLTQKLFEN